jgi:feruloyl esterase
MMRRCALLVVLAMFALAAPAVAASEPGTGPSGVIAPVLACGQLAAASFGALGVVRSATEQTVDGFRYCEVDGETAPDTTVQMLLPLDGWQGQYLQQGCFAYCGSSTIGAQPLAGCVTAPDGALAMAKDDGGHSSTDQEDAGFGQDPALREVFGRTSEHSTALLAKAVLRTFYGTAPRYSYYDGCSTGGRQGLVEAQDYPADFDGILAGAPIINMASISLEQAWLVVSNTDAHGRQILTSEKLPALHAAVVRQCGDATGTVTEPRQCAFDPASLRCAAGADTDSCLTSAQVATVREFYRGPTTTSGVQLFNGGMLYGSELGWQSWAVMPRADTAAPGDTQAAQTALGAFRDLYFPRNPSASFSLADVRFTVAEYLRGEGYAQHEYNATNPDLRAFRARGGKLILYHGLADEAVSPQSTQDYYAWVERLAGGFTASQQFSRLYLVPGAYHCLFGPDVTAPTRYDVADFLDPLIDWVQHGTAPGTLDAPDISLDGSGPEVDHSVHPVDALKPAPAAPGSLNAGYHYVGAVSDYLIR